MPQNKLTDDFRRLLELHDKEAWRQIAELVKKAGQYGAFKAGVLHHADDVVAEVLMMFHSNFLKTLDRDANLPAFLVEVSRRVAFSIRRKNGEHREISKDSSESVEIAYENTIDAISQSMDETISVKIAEEKAKERIKQRTGGKLLINYLPEKGERRIQYGCGDHKLSAELRFERSQRGWSQKQMAAYLGVGKPTYLSYEHARVKTPNPRILEELRKLQRERSNGKHK